ncbi:cytochrome P450/oxidoreductase [Cryptosporangium japonicum]|uniref:Cytochrome P450/oxidoreductase n=1 Tax=Cryptosporangium japonicum TaxID=80872 RepID=A0ABN0UDT4_9ACTN
MSEKCPFSDPAALFDDLARARTTSGLTWSTALNSWVVSRYDDVVEALHRPDLYSSAPTVPELPEFLAGRIPGRGTLIGHDNPTHDRLRSAVNTFFVPRRLVRYEPWIDAAAHGLVDGFADRGAAELKAEFGLPLALTTITHVVGLDTARADWIGLALSSTLGPRDVHYAHVDPAEKLRAYLELHDYVRQVMDERRRERRDDLISHVWNVRDAGEVTMTDFEMLSLFPGLLLAGHETTSSLICTAVAHLLSHPGAYRAAQHDDDTRARALEELLRFESAITGMPRRVTRDTTLGGTALREGEQVFLAYASGSRDPARFDSPAELRTDRNSAPAHLGFGQGIHACLGAPLARLLLRTELRVLHERLPGLRLATPLADLTYGPVSSARGLTHLPLRWDPAPRRATRRRSAPLTATITGRTALTDDVVELELAGDLPPWQPDAHIDVHLGDGLVRSYSLCGDPAERHWRIAVRRDGVGSRHVHERLAVGDTVRLGGPRSNFGLVDARRHLFIAGGIGITPFLPMLGTVEPWRLVYLGRGEASMPYAARLRERHPGRVTLWSGPGRFDLAALLAGTDPDTAVYCCGPERLVAAVEALAPGVRTERFAPRPLPPTTHGEFDVTLAASNRTVTVAAGESVLDAINRAGANVPSTCREGTCGTCEVRVLAGEPEHRDSVLTAAERAAGTYLLPCVSRSRTPSITLDV